MLCLSWALIARELVFSLSGTLAKIIADREAAKKGNRKPIDNSDWDSDTDSSSDSHDTSSEDSKSSTLLKGSQEVLKLAARMRNPILPTVWLPCPNQSPDAHILDTYLHNPRPPPPKKQRFTTARSDSPPTRRISHFLSVQLAYLCLKGEKRNTLGIHTHIINFPQQLWSTDILTGMYKQLQNNATGIFPLLEFQKCGKNLLPALPPINCQWVQVGTGIAPCQPFRSKVWLDIITILIYWINI